jgi:acylphosphatase
MSGPVRRRVVVTGHVQGVFFRNSAQREAESAGVTGWVRNLPDGRVEAVFEGDPPAVERLVAWAHQGPSKARVVDVRVVDESPCGDPRFEVH